MLCSSRWWCVRFLLVRSKAGCELRRNLSARDDSPGGRELTSARGAGSGFGRRVLEWLAMVFDLCFEVLFGVGLCSCSACGLCLCSALWGACRAPFCPGVVGVAGISGCRCCGEPVVLAGRSLGMRLGRWSSSPDAAEVPELFVTRGWGARRDAVRRRRLGCGVLFATCGCGAGRRSATCDRRAAPALVRGPCVLGWQAWSYPRLTRRYHAAHSESCAGAWGFGGEWACVGGGGGVTVPVWAYCCG
jgi:hypothetical protein